MTENNNAGLFELRNWNEYNLKVLTSNNWRASLVPAAAVIPAPIAYIHIVAVKKLVVECKARRCGALRRYCAAIAPRMRCAGQQCPGSPRVTVRKLGCS